MLEESTPKIILNDEYLDLRKYPENNVGTNRSFIGISANTKNDHSKPRASNLKCEGLRYEKELINCGLKKLANTFNAKGHVCQRSGSPISKKKVRQRECTNFDRRFRRTVAEEEKASCLKSQSEFSVYPIKLQGDNNSSSTPIVREKMCHHEREKSKQDDIIKHQSTMTKEENHRKLTKNPNKTERTCNRLKSKNYKENHITNQYVDPRLCEKYSILKMPWKRTWTLPVFSPKSSTVSNNNGGDIFDRQTYLYDDGTEVDSAYLEAKQQSFVSKVHGAPFLGGSLCGILLVSLFIWLIFGHNLLSIFFKPRDMSESALKQYSKYIGGGIIHIITNLFRTLGRILAIPTQQVYRPQQEYYKWPVNPT